MATHVIKHLFPTLFLLALAFPTFSQSVSATVPKDWFLKDPELDQVQGISVDRAYNTVLKNQPSKTIIVAVIDSGAEIDHEDLRNVIWTNEDEIPDNGIDDDNNGYIDDVHGWNFIGGKDGNVNEDTDELTREYVRLKKIYGDADGTKITKRQKEEYEQFLRIKTKFEQKT